MSCGSGTGGRAGSRPGARRGRRRWGSRAPTRGRTGRGPPSPWASRLASCRRWRCWSRSLRARRVPRRTAARERSEPS
ncbi:hypothetical protein ESP62_015275 [Aeromicrobium fastidiosum]|uniref:Uncharacterized protein n=1 Tax=Aeromicrobium fastidiosum TaxID=52699 RepID=A0A641AKA6_9ACTN|nr:hypothetical protein ESP62_015275 [Aeromicrobium fastidiosum]